MRQRPSSGNRRRNLIGYTAPGAILPNSRPPAGRRRQPFLKSRTPWGCGKRPPPHAHPLSHIRVYKKRARPLREKWQEQYMRGGVTQSTNCPDARCTPRFHRPAHSPFTGQPAAHVTRHAPRHPCDSASSPERAICRPTHARPSEHLPAASAPHASHDVRTARADETRPHTGPRHLPKSPRNTPSDFQATRHSTRLRLPRRATAPVRQAFHRAPSARTTPHPRTARAIRWVTRQHTARLPDSAPHVVPCATARRSPACRTCAIHRAAMQHVTQLPNSTPHVTSAPSAQHATRHRPYTALAQPAPRVARAACHTSPVW